MSKKEINILKAQPLLCRGGSYIYSEFSYVIIWVAGICALPLFAGDRCDCTTPSDFFYLTLGFIVDLNIDGHVVDGVFECTKKLTYAHVWV
ncbi:hypothetical protein ACJX0J_009630 [Zea mays]